jgi:hypothetical protein
MDDPHWQPRCELPDDLVRPTRLDPTGVAGPTRGQAQGDRWRRTSHGFYVPAHVDGSRPEQRILEQAVRVADRGAVTGWASLRWRGATYFDGTSGGGRERLAVPLLRRSGARAQREVCAAISRGQLAKSERELVQGIWCTTVQRGLFDRMRFQRSVREAVVDLDMAAAAGLISIKLFEQYVAMHPAWEGVVLVREALSLASERSRSPQEVRMRLVWVVDLGLDPPLVNRPVFDLRGNLLGIPDLLDPVAGVIGEYDGAAHKARDRHRKDVAREDRFRGVGLECFRVVGGDLQDRSLVAKRMTATRERAWWRPPEQRLWTTTPPAWWHEPETLDARFERWGMIEALTHR